MKRTERDMSMRVVVIGSAVIVVMMWALLKFKPIPGAMTSGFSEFSCRAFRDCVWFSLRYGGVTHPAG